MRVIVLEGPVFSASMMMGGRRSWTEKSQHIDVIWKSCREFCTVLIQVLEGKGPTRFFGKLESPCNKMDKVLEPKISSW